MNLKLVAWAAIVNAILIVPLFIVGFLIGFLTAQGKAVPNSLPVASAVLTILGTITAVLILLGFLQVANKTKKVFLKNMSYVAIVAVVLLGVYAVASSLQLALFMKWAIVTLVMIGVVNILFGMAACFSLKNNLRG